MRYHEDLRAAEDTDFAIRLALEGVRFVMADEPGAVWHDLHDPGRASLGARARICTPWLETLRARIPPRAYHGYRGWAIAKVVATTHPLRALEALL